MVATELARLGAPFRLLVRDPGRAPSLPADVAVADYADRAALERALEPGDRVFMVSVNASPAERLPLHRGFVEAAVARRVGRVVYLSFVAAGPEAWFLHARAHGATEQMLRDSGLPHTAVRNAMYADQIPDWFDPEGRLTGPGGDGRASFTYRPELAEAIALLLADDAHDGREVVTVTGAESLTCAELAAVASRVTGDDYRYEPADREAWKAYRRALGRPDWSIEMGLSYYDGLARGEADVVGDDFRRLTGRDPLPLAEVVERLRDELPLSRSRG